ncbi:hypothetical protein [Streptomyces sp. LN590]|uniref:hypothetical protein n=1 Tax=Streptomyces sp. LN590 TaxID=3112980 RepID=UPI003715750F
MTEVVKQAEPQEPVWKAPFVRFVTYLEDAERLVQLAYTGAKAILSIHKLFDLVEEDGDSSDERVKRERQVTLAQTEISSDFKLLHGHSIVGIWGALESLIEDVVECWMAFRPEVLMHQNFVKIRVPLAEFLSLSDEQRVRLLVSEVQRDLKLDLRSGVTKFEKLLDSVGLGGPVDPRIRDALFEAQNIRNVLAHRAGIVDQRFVDSCPSFGLSEGDQMVIGKKLFRRMSDAMGLYSIVVLNRVFVAVGRPTQHPNERKEFEGATRFGYESKGELSDAS